MHPEGLNNYTRDGDEVLTYALTDLLWRWEVRTAAKRLLQTGTAPSKAEAALDGVRWYQATQQEKR